eukprot:317551-Chlamydomonas_euryale.AAC.2
MSPPLLCLDCRPRAGSRMVGRSIDINPSSGANKGLWRNPWLRRMRSVAKRSIAQQSAAKRSIAQQSAALRSKAQHCAAKRCKAQQSAAKRSKAGHVAAPSCGPVAGKVLRKKKRINPLLTRTKYLQVSS